MAANYANGTDELQFVDPSVDPSILFDFSKYLADVGTSHLTIHFAKEILRRFPAIEYAVGFDGVDDWIGIDELDIGRDGIDIETKIWISQDNHGGELLDIASINDNSILRLTDTPDEDVEIRAYHRNSDGMQNTVLSGIKPETWQSLRVWSDGGIFSIEIDGTQVSIMPDIDLQNGPFKLYFGTSSRRSMYFRGMVKHLQVQSGTNQHFNLQAGETFNVKDMTYSADLVGIHNLKKGRFRKQFRA